MNRKLVMETAAQACACGKFNMPVVAVKVLPDDTPFDAWNIGYVCKACGLHEIFYVAETMLNGSPKTAQKLMSL